MTRSVCRYALAVFLLTFNSTLFAQSYANHADSLESQRDANGILSDFFSGKNRPPKVVDMTKEGSWSVLPSAAYNPSVGFAIGAISSGGKYFGNPANTTLSVVNAGVYISTNKLSTFELKHNAFSSENKWNLQGVFQVGKTIAKDNGLGTGRRSFGDGELHMNNEHFANNPNEFPVRYVYLKVNERIYRKIVPAFYVGAGLSFNFYSHIDDDRKNIPITETHNFRYSVQNGYPTSAYQANGILINFQFNNRDQPNRPFRGVYADVILKENETWLGSNRKALQLRTEFRKYWSLSSSNPENVLAFWHWANYLISGSLPYLDLPGTGSDAYGRIGRAFIIGRFKGLSFVYNEAEYRFPITDNKLLSGVTFVNIESADNQRNIKLLRYWEPGGGVGLRLLFNKYTRSNLCIDYGRGSYGSSGFFLGLNEVF
ncbi:BamA/TamA family outer membrane protein [Mucilaginibacter aquaedulcis]|uniref:BamA/TamA family outer membrane protein n=1 Tax=Mucilaginibacter aquaedulcis TaxID=1187081 RepID=UPI0025B48538|nr:BamA/TamA family outer membrane protein [Mucilaginibacter aquaedulcis]MDN3551338.1 BamA/TamA family outer membrane protein [Mucilaginibacter aquaedulcis]